MPKSQRLSNLFLKKRLKGFSFSDMTREDAYELIKDCVYEVQKRLIINMPRFQVITFDFLSYSNLCISKRRCYCSLIVLTSPQCISDKTFLSI